MIISWNAKDILGKKIRWYMQIFSFSKHSFNTHYVSGLEIGPGFDGPTRPRPDKIYLWPGPARPARPNN
jgi:hypothetical protein